MLYDELPPGDEPTDNSFDPPIFWRWIWLTIAILAGAILDGYGRVLWHVFM